MKFSTTKSSEKLLGLPLIIIGILSIVSEPADAVDLRGRVESPNYFSQKISPLRNARVTLFKCQQVGNCQEEKTTFTGSDGFYYFSDVSPGSYRIQVNQGGSVNIIIKNRPYEDIPPIRVYK